MGGPRPDFSQPPPGYHAGMPPPTFRPAGSNVASLPPRMPLPPTPMTGGGDRGWGSPAGARGGPGIGAGAPASSGSVGGGVPQGGQTTLFIGGISAGISDEILEQLLNVRLQSFRLRPRSECRQADLSRSEIILQACGQLRSLKRVRGATGKPQPFGFAECVSSSSCIRHLPSAKLIYHPGAFRFEDPDAVLRALVVLNGIELPNLEARSDPGKKLIVRPLSSFHRCLVHAS